MSRQELADAVNAYLAGKDGGRYRHEATLDANHVGKLERGEHRWPNDVRREAFRHVLSAATDTELGFYIIRGVPERDSPDPSWCRERTLAAQLVGNGWPDPDPTDSRPALPPGDSGADDNRDHDMHRPVGCDVGQGPLTSTTAVNGLETGRLAVRALLPAIRCVLDVHDLPADGPVRPVLALQDEVGRVVEMRLQSNYRQLAAVLPHLLPELHRAFKSHVGQRRAVVAGLLAQTYRAADAVADKFGYYDLSARIIGLMIDAARESGDELALATAAYVRAETFFANGQFETGRGMLERAAQRLMPDSSTGAAAAYGALHMRAAVLAARAGCPASARDHVAEARSYARWVPDGTYNGTVFGPASVQIHEVALAVDAGQPAAALGVATDWVPPDDLPAERRSHFYIEIARAGSQIGALDLSLTALITARRIAPEHARHHPQVHQVLGELLHSDARRDDRVQEYARWAKAPSAVS